MVDTHGVVRGLRARRLIKGEHKSLAPAGQRRAPLVFACGLARQVLELGQVPDWWEGPPLRIEVCEGEKKFLIRALRHSDANEFAPAVLGIVSGSWTSEFAARIPDGATLYIATDQNEAGARYATKILRSLESRIEAGAVRLELRREFEFYEDADQKLAVRIKGSS
jgi:hypothetical protein